MIAHMNQAISPTMLSADAWSQYRANLPRHLIGLARYMQSRLMHNLIEERGHSDLALHFEPYLVLAGSDGIRLSELAEALAISKQAVNQAVNQIERAGYLRREADPEDGRARRVTLTDDGHRLIAEGAELLQGVEREFIDIAGETSLDKFTLLLADMHTTMNLPQSAFSATARQPTRTSAALGWLLPRISDGLMQNLMERTRARGHAGLKMSFGQVLTLMSPEGGRIQEMARINEVSKQAISAIASELEDLGYLQRVPDPDDRRQVILAFTGEGVRLIEDSIESTRALDRDFLDAIGRRRLASLKRTAELLYQELGLENEVFGSGKPDIDSLADDLLKQLGIRDARLLAQQLKDLTESKK